MTRQIQLLGILFVLVFSIKSPAQSLSGTTESSWKRKLSSRQEDTVRMRILIEVAREFVNKPGEVPSDLKTADSLAIAALMIAQHSQSPSGIGAAYTVQAQVARERGDGIAGKDFAEKAQSALRQAKTPGPETAFADMEMANYLSIEIPSQLDQKIELYQHATDLLKQFEPNTLTLADALKFLGDLYGVKRDLPRASTALGQALVIYENIHYQQLQDIYSLIGDIYARMGMTNESLQYQLQALRTAQKFSDSSATAMLIYNRLGYINGIVGQRNTATNAFEQAMTLARRNHDTSGILVVAGNLAWSYFRGDASAKAIRTVREAIPYCPTKDTAEYLHLIFNLVEAYVNIGDFQQAQYYFDQMQRRMGAQNLPLVVHQNFHYAAFRYYMARRLYDKVDYHLAALSRIAEEMQDVRNLSQTELYKYQVDSTRGLFKEALTHYGRYKAYSDSLNNRNHDKQITLLQLQFDTERKDQDIVEKARDIEDLTQKNGMQQRALASEQLSKRLIIGLVLLLSLALGIGYSRYRLKQRSNRRLEEQQAAINRQNDSLKKLVAEREWLLKEVHHRVKNNLQIVISLLNSQAIYVNDDATMGVIQESQHRMNSIALIHQKLYQGENLSGIQMHDYVYELVIYLQNSFSTRGRIAFVVDIDPITLDVSQAVPIGLIFNEAITNSIKYAFGDRRDGRIHIGLRLQGSDALVLFIRDNGKGLKASFDLEHVQSMGMNLMKGLSGQLGGELKVINVEGLELRLELSRIALLQMDGFPSL